MSAEYPCIYWEKDGKCRRFSDDTYISYCVMGPCPEQKLSNADHIRAMSDEELARMIACCDTCTDICLNEYEKGRIIERCNGNCLDSVLKWLQQPAEEET